MNQETQTKPRIGGLAGWLLARLRREPRSARRLVICERLALGPRQHLTVVEADGSRFLVATGANGTPTLHALSQKAAERRTARRISW